MPAVEVILALAAFGFFCQALEIKWQFGRLTVQPGWLGFTIWGGLAALRTSDGNGDNPVATSGLVIIISSILFVTAIVTVLITQRTKHALQEIHTLVNSQSDRQIEEIKSQATEIKQLTQSLKEAEG